MKLRFKSMAVASVLATCVVLSACGGSGSGSDGGSSITNASVDSSNAQTLSGASAEAAKQAISQSNAPARDVGAQSPAEVAQQLVLSLAQNTGTAGKQARISQTIPGSCGGSATVTSNNGGSITTVYNNWCEGGMTADGSATMTTYQNGGWKIVYSNFTISYGGETHTLNMTASCDAQGNCSYSESFTGSDGRSYRVEGSSVSGNSSSGYNVNATVYDPDHGRFEISARGVTFNCSHGHPGSGSITFSGSDGSSGSVTFNSCTSYTVTVNGVGNTYTW